NLAELVELVPDWAAAHKLPYIFVERTEFFPYCQELSSVHDRSVDFETVTYDASVAKQTLDISVLVTGNFRRVEAVECLAIIFTFVQDRLPCESCLCTLQREKLEKHPVIMHPDSPFSVMILDHQWIVAEGRPVTPRGRK